MHFREWLLLSEKIEVNGVQFRDKLEALKYIYNNHPAPQNLVVSYTQINKIGINPKSGWSTPFGIYLYPLDYVIGKKLSVPFAGDKPYINVCEFTRPDKILHMQTPAEPQLGIDLLKKTFDETEVDSTIDRIKSSEDIKIRSNYSTVWLVTQLLAEYKPIQWNSNLRKLGIDGFLDHGTGTIHGNEPTQGVVLTANALKVIHVIENLVTYTPPYSIQKLSFPSDIKQEIVKNVQLNNMNNLIKLIDKYPISENNSFYAYGVFEAASKNNFKIVKYLVDKGTHIYDEAVYEAIGNNNSSMVKYLVNSLLARKQDIPIKSVEFARQHADEDIEEFLIEKGAKITSSVVKEAIDSKDFKAVKFLVDKNAEIDYLTMDHLSSLIKDDPHPATYIDIFKYIVKNSKDNQIKKEAITYAVQSEEENLLKYLVEEEGFEVNTGAVISAMKQMNFKLAKYLIPKGGDKLDNNICLNVAGRLGNKEIADMFIDKADTPDAAIEATRYGHFDIAKNILDKKGIGIPSHTSLIAMAFHYLNDNYNLRNYKKVFNFIKYLVEEKKYRIISSNISSAILTGRFNLVKLLFDHLDDSVKVNEFEATKYAVISNNIKIIKYLVEDKKFKLGSDAIEWAVLAYRRKKNTDIIEYLISKGAKISKQDVAYYTKELNRDIGGVIGGVIEPVEIDKILELLNKNINA